MRLKPCLRVPLPTDHPPGAGGARPGVMPGPYASGFTLLEVLISISLIAMLMLALLFGLRVAGKAWQQGETRLRQTHIEEERNAFVMDQVSSLLPYAVSVSDRDLSGRFTIFEASPTCLRFVTSYGSAFRGRSGLLLAEYGIVESRWDGVELALRETPILNDEVLLRRVVRGVAQDQETGAPVVIYQPFAANSSDLKLMSGLRAASFEYLDLHPPGGRGAIWLPNWNARHNAAYPDAIRLTWALGNQTGQQFIPIRARLLPQMQTFP